MTFEDPIMTTGAAESLVQDVRSAVIIPGESHEDLWVHPNVVAIPGNPVVIELSLRSTDRNGEDRHSTFNYFRTEDDFKTLRPITEPSAPGWRWIGLTREDFKASGESGPPGPPAAEWHWARNAVHIDADTIIHPFTPRDGERRFVQTVTSRVDGDELVPLRLSNVLANPVKRGFLEPQIARFDDQLFMTLRAEDGNGYVSVSADAGRNWNRPRPWTWNDGEEIHMTTTMTKLLSHSAGLLLVYTRVREDNQDVMRSRAPLHCADVDPLTLSLKRNTERILVPNRGLPLGNFWVCPINQYHSYVAVAEWPRDGRKANGDVWLAKIRWKTPNERMAPQESESNRIKDNYGES